VVLSNFLARNRTWFCSYPLRDSRFLSRSGRWESVTCPSVCGMHPTPTCLGKPTEATERFCDHCVAPTEARPPRDVTEALTLPVPETRVPVSPVRSKAQQLFARHITNLCHEVTA
jgi:hypothetical protein